jgi:DNA-binding NtrC family response regulator
MKQVRESAEHVAGTDLPVLIVGETGTGKELAATLVHSFSKRSGGPLTTVNCAAIPRDLFESEVFGHERGAFTGAHARRIGLIEQADGGTLFLDEVGDLSLENQARLLRALENRRFRRLGGEKDIEVSFRLISASNKPLEAMVAAQTFRRDFYHRLRGVELSIPPLRARASDIEELADFFFQQARIHAKRPLRGFTPGALSFLSEHNWPGNVRELKYTVNAAVATAKGECLTDDDLKRLIAGQYGETVLLPLAEVEREHILRVLEKCNNKVLHAAKVLGISKTMLYKRLAEYDAGGLCKDGR